MYRINKEWLAIIFMMIGPTFMTLGFVYSNEKKLHPSTTAFVRGFAIAIITYLCGWAKEIDLTFKSPHNFKWQIIRNSIMIVHTLVYAWSQFYLPLPIAITLNSTSSIFASILDKVINNISLNKFQIIWLIIAFMGVILTANG